MNVLLNLVFKAKNNSWLTQRLTFLNRTLVYGITILGPGIQHLQGPIAIILQISVYLA
jgi:hypothetical protein